MARIANPSEIVDILNSQLIASGWHNIMRSYTNTTDYENLYKHLLKEVEENNRFTPPIRYLMEPFTHCPYSDLKVVFIADSPYDVINVANGLAFSHPVSLNKETELKVLHNKIVNEVYDNKKPVSSFTSDLRVWAEQGILLLNSSFTTEINKKCNHYDLWKPFLSHMLDMLNSDVDDIVYVLFGTNAQYFNELIDTDKNLLLQLDNPKDHNYKWDSKDMFTKINNYLENVDKEKIVW